MRHRPFLAVLTTGLGVLTAIGVLWMHSAVGLSMHTVLSNSMLPAFTAGDQLITLDRDPLQLQRNDIVLIRTASASVPTAHRVQAVDVNGIRVSVQTKGDANATPDQWSDLIVGEPVPVVVAVIPGLMDNGPGTWPTRTKVLAITLTGLLVTAGLVAPQWRGQACECPRCQQPALCPSCHEGVRSGEEATGPALPYP